jgi:hypothetical protein
MSNTNTGGPAFPGTQYANGVQPTGFSQGMTLRDYFAAKAMQSILAREDGRFTTTLEFVGGKAYQYADAMLKAREA